MEKTDNVSEHTEKKLNIIKELKSVKLAFRAYLKRRCPLGFFISITQRELIAEKELKDSIFLVSIINYFECVLKDFEVENLSDVDIYDRMYFMSMVGNIILDQCIDLIEKDL